MYLPSKVTPYSESVLTKLPIFLSKLERQGNMTVLNLFDAVRDDVVNVGEYVEVLDCLYALRKIRLTDGGQLLILLGEEDA
jgi:hypothetical protein